MTTETLRRYRRRFQFVRGTISYELTLTAPSTGHINDALAYVDMLVNTELIPAATQVADKTDVGEGYSQVTHGIHCSRDGWSMNIDVKLSLRDRPGANEELLCVLGHTTGFLHEALTLLIEPSFDGLDKLFGFTPEDLAGAKGSPLMDELNELFAGGSKMHIVNLEEIRRTPRPGGPRVRPYDSQRRPDLD